MINIEDLQEEVLNELFGITNFSSTIRGLFNGKTPDSALNPPKKILDRKLNAANRIQHASGFLSDKSLNDVDIPTFLRQAMAKGADASKPEQAALRKTGYKVGPPGYNTYGKVGGAADTVSAATMADAAKRRSVYANRSYASIRESQNQTIQRLLNEMRLEEWRVTPQLADKDYRYKVQDRAFANYMTNLDNEGGRKNPSRKTKALRTATQFLTNVDDAHGAMEDRISDALSSASRDTVYDNIGAEKSERVTNRVVGESYTYDEALINQIIEELLEGFIFDPAKHTTAGPVDPKTGIGARIPGPLHGMEFQSMQHAWDMASQRTPSGEPMGDMNHLIVKPEEKKVQAPVPPAEQAPEGDVQDKLDPMKRIQPIAAPVK